MKQLVVLWVSKFLPDDRDECAMIHVAYMVIVNSWFGRPFVKWHFDGDCSLGPGSALESMIW